MTNTVRRHIRGGGSAGSENSGVCGTGSGSDSWIHNRRAVAAEMDVCVAFAIAFSVGFLEATVGSTTVRAVATEMDACVAFAFAF